MPSKGKVAGNVRTEKRVEKVQPLNPDHVVELVIDDFSGVNNSIICSAIDRARSQAGYTMGSNDLVEQMCRLIRVVCQDDKRGDHGEIKITVEVRDGVVVSVLKSGDFMDDRLKALMPKCESIESLALCQCGMSNR